MNQQSENSFQGKVIIFSAPSGSGKTTIARHLLGSRDDLGFSISATTRNRRDGVETDGKDYYFITTDEFQNKIENKEFIEWEEVYNGSFYGTLRSEVERLWKERKHVIFDVDVIGGLRLKKFFKEKALAIFVKPPSIEELEKRLKKRNTEDGPDFNQRIFKAKAELKYEPEFDVTIINDSLELACQNAANLVKNYLGH